MTKSYSFSARAVREVETIVEWFERTSGSERAEEFRAELLRNFSNIVSIPDMGGEREDLTSKDVRFWTVGSELIVYRDDSALVRVLRVVQMAWDPRDDRDYVPDRNPADVAAVIDVPLNEREIEYLTQRVRWRGAPNAGELLRCALRSMIDPRAEQARTYEAWKEYVRRAIEVGYEQCLRGELVDGDAVFERLRLRIEARRGRS